MTTYGLTSTGFVPKDLATIRAEIEADFKTAFGESIDLSDGAPFGQLAGILAERYALLWQLAEAVNSSVDPDKATGAELDALCALTGTTRKAATPSTVTGTLTGTPSTLVPSGSQASEATTGVKFKTIADATITAATAWAGSTAYSLGDRVTNGPKVYQCVTAGTSAASGGPSGTGTGIVDNTAVWDYLGDGTAVVDVAMESVDTGPKVAIARSITVIETPVSGWSSVINVLAATQGVDVETDGELRIRRENELAASGTTTIDAIRTALLAVDSVTSVSLFVNNTDTTDPDGVPPHSIEALVQGGSSQDIVDALFANVAAGIYTHGSNFGTAVDSEGNSHTIHYSTPTPINAYIDITLTYDATLYPADGDDQIKTAIVTNGGKVSPGKDIVASQIKAWCFTVPGVLDVSLAKIAKTPSPTTETTVAIAAREIANYLTSNIAVTSSAATP